MKSLFIKVHLNKSWRRDGYMGPVISRNGRKSIVRISLTTFARVEPKLNPISPRMLVNGKTKALNVSC